MTKIYDQHGAAFNQVSAYVITNEDGNRVATLAFKFPRDGAGRLYCYFHWIGDEMIRGYAGGYGYDKRSAAVENIMAQLRATPSFRNADQVFGKGADSYTDLLRAFKDIGGKDWSDVFRDVQLNALQAV